MIRFLLRALSPSGPGANLIVFIFHRVLPQLDPLLPSEPDASQFSKIVALISRSFSVLPLTEAAARLRDGSLPAAAAAITFDDGYRDNWTVAWPILARHQLPATFFIASGFLDGGRMWNDDVIESVRIAPEGLLDWREFGLGRHQVSDIASRVKIYEEILGRLKYFEHVRRATIAHAIAVRYGLPDASQLMMSSDQVRELRMDGADIGGHTHTHPILEMLDDGHARTEIKIGRDRLETILGERIRVFAYPNGVPGRDFSRRHVALVREAGFEVAVSTYPAPGDVTCDPLQLPRFTPWERAPSRFAARCVIQLLGAASAGRRSA